MKGVRNEEEGEGKLMKREEGNEGKGGREEGKAMVKGEER